MRNQLNIKITQNNFDTFPQNILNFFLLCSWKFLFSIFFYWMVICQISKLINTHHKIQNKKNKRIKINLKSFRYFNEFWDSTYKDNYSILRKLKNKIYYNNAFNINPNIIGKIISILYRSGHRVWWRGQEKGGWSRSQHSRRLWKWQLCT